MTSPVLAGAGPLPAPELWRRMACFLYEGVLLFGVVMVAGLIYSPLTRQSHALQGTTGLQVFLFVVLGAYFVGFWTRAGQTLAMRTWHVKLVTAGGQPVSMARAAVRYLLSWLWFLPALTTLYFAGLHGAAPIFAAITAGVLAYAALAWLRPDRQFWHDAACGTRLITWRPQARPAS